MNNVPAREGYNTTGFDGNHYKDRDLIERKIRKTVQEREEAEAQKQQEKQEKEEETQNNARISNTKLNNTNNVTPNITTQRPDKIYTYPPEVTYKSGRKSIVFDPTKEYVNIDTGDVYKVLKQSETIVSGGSSYTSDLINTKYELRLVTIGTPGIHPFSPFDKYYNNEKKENIIYEVEANLTNTNPEKIQWGRDPSDRMQQIQTNITVYKNGEVLKKLVELNDASRHILASKLTLDTEQTEDFQKEEGGSLKKYKKKTKKSKKQTKRKRTRKQKHHRNKK
jgi:hypothetical protein